MAVKRSGGAIAALLLAGVTYLWKNRKQVSNSVKELGQNVQGQLSHDTKAPTNQTNTSTPEAYIGETKRI